MDGEYATVDPAAAERALSEKSGTEHVDLTGALGLTESRARVWYLEPGHDRKGTHVHERQEELYVVLSGPGRMAVGGDDLTVPEGGAVRVPPGTPRRLFNDADREHAWLVVGAPPVEGDGRQVE